MKAIIKSASLLSAASALAIAVPAAAHPGPSGHPDGTKHSLHSHKCAPHNVAYVESGTVDATTASTLAKNPDGTWSGTLVVDVTHANHWAKGDKGTTVTYTFTNAKLTVRDKHGVSSLAAGDQIKLIGKLAVVAKKCAALTPASTPQFRMVVLGPPAAS